MSATSPREIHRLLDEAPFVGALARALAGHDADEVVQGTWLQAMEGDASIRHPRQWLACAVRGVAHNLRRRRARRDVHERAAARRDPAPSTTELMERQERRRELVQAVDALHPPLRTVVLLRYFENLPPRGIAEHLGLPVTTVTSRLRSALTTLRQRLDDQHGDRRAWLLPILPATATGLATGVLAMTAKAKVGVAVAAIVLAVLALWTLGAPPVPPTGSGGPGQVSPMTAAAQNDREARQAEVERTEVVTPVPAAEPTTGALTVKAIYSEDGAPVVDLLVYVGRPGADRRYGRHRVRTDEQGIARLEDLAEGRFTVANALNYTYARAEVVAGADTEVELALPVGVLITGIVVDRFGVPVPGAEVMLSGLGAAEDPELVATADADGRFALRSCNNQCYVGARAVGHSSSQMQLVFSDEGGSRELRIELPAPGGIVEGIVLGPDRLPMADAVVTIGPRLRVRPPLTRTGPDGRFRALGIAAGRHPVQVRSALTAPWSGSCLVEANLVTSLEVALDPGMSCTGVVVDAGGSPVPQAEIVVGNLYDFASYRTQTADDGTFRLDGLPPGEVEIRASRGEIGRTSVTVRGGPGETVSCELRLGSGLKLRGRVLSESDEPVASARLVARVQSPRSELAWSGWAESDATGRFAISDCPEGRLLTLTAQTPGFHPFGISDIDPRAGELLIRLASAPPRSARIVGSIVAPDGQPVPHAMLQAYGAAGQSSSFRTATDSGSFELGPLVPGAWSMWIEAPGHPRVSTERRELGVDEVWDLGEIRFPVPGTILVRLGSDEGLQPYLTVADPTLHRRFGFEQEGEPYRSELLSPGPQYVSVGGDGVAAQLVPVEVRSGEESVIDIELQPAHRRQFQIETPTVLTELHLRIMSGDELVTGSSDVGRGPGTIPMERELWLAPGDYTITAAGNGLSGDARFTVREDTDDVVRVVLR